jgi:hypothetical protein
MCALGNACHHFRCRFDFSSHDKRLTPFARP